MKDIMLFMNTWANYNEYGADSGITPTGWMSIEDAREYDEKYADYEPFINDIENSPFSVSEYSNVSAVLDKLERYEELSDYDKDVFDAILADQNDDFESAMQIVESGDYTYIPGVDTYEDLAYELIDELGGLDNAVSKDSLETYFDYAKLGRDLGFDDYADNFDEDERNKLYEDGKISDPDYVNAGYYFCGDEDATDDEIGTAYVDMAGGIDEISNPENYFDYKGFGRDLSYEGWIFTDNGAVQYN